MECKFFSFGLENWTEKKSSRETRDTPSSRAIYISDVIRKDRVSCRKGRKYLINLISETNYNPIITNPDIRIIGI